MAVVAGISALAGAGASIYAGEKQAGAIEDSSELQFMAQMEALALQKKMYEQSREDLAPYRETGTNALTQLAAMYGVSEDGFLSAEDMDAARERYKETPGYDFRFREGEKALMRNAAARGKLHAGETSKDLLNYGQGMATAEYGNYLRGMRDLAGIGQAATGQQVSLNTNLANTSGNYMLQGAARRGETMADAAASRASGYVGAGNALQGFGQNYMLMKYLQQGGSNPAGRPRYPSGDYSLNYG